MTSPFTLPPGGFGPGSQPVPDGELHYMPMPSGMRTYAPHLPQADDPAALAEALALLERLAAACDRAAAGGTAPAVELAALSAGARRIVADALGQGEVSMKLHGRPAIIVQESVFAGVWMLLGAGVDRLEVGPVPALARARAHDPQRPALGMRAARRAGIVNAPGVLAELAEHAGREAAEGAAHVVNLSLLPHTPEDLLWLDEALGEGSVTILSRGYGNCRITATAHPRVWKVQFYNSMDTLILDTFEVTAMPEVAMAAPEDLADSAARLSAVIGALA